MGLSSGFTTATALCAFTSKRKEQLEIIESFNEEDWEKQESHDAHIMYNLYILVRHILMHDYVHVYRIREAWLTKDAYL